MSIDLGVQERRQAAFAGYGNSDAKCLTVLGFDGGIVRGAFKMYYDFITMSGRVWLVDSATPLSYCRRGLTKYGVVINESGERYRLSDEGVKYHQPLAAHFLYQSAWLPYPLAKIFGPSARSNRAEPSLTRVRLLEFAYQQQRVCQVSELKDIAKTDLSTLSRAARYLAGLGYMVFFPGAGNNERGVPRYQYLGGPPPEAVTFGRYPAIGRVIYPALQNAGEANPKEMAGRLRREFLGFTTSNLERAIATSLMEFTGQGYCEPSEIGDNVSDFELTDKGRVLVEQLINPVTPACQGNQAVLDSFRSLPWEQIAPAVTKRHKDHSRYASSKKRLG